MKYIITACAAAVTIIIIACMVIACSKQQKEDAPLFFRMNYQQHKPRIDRAVQFTNCDSTREVEIAAYDGDAFFKINFLLDSPKRKSFWYTNQGMSYVAKPFDLHIHSYTDGLLKASFGGGVVHDGKINLFITKQ